MNEMNDSLQDASQKKKMSTGSKWAIGCGCGCLSVILLAAVIGIAGFAFFKKTVETYENELKGLGFETVVSGQSVDITSPITEPALYKGQIVRILSNSETDVAVLAQACEIYGTIHGKVYFRGQMLTIHPEAVITDGLDIQAQVLLNEGSVSGDISGQFQSLPAPHGETPAEYDERIDRL